MRELSYEGLSDLIKYGTWYRQYGFRTTMYTTSSKLNEIVF